MPYKDGNWGVKAKERSKKRRKYFHHYNWNNRLRTRMGKNIPEHIDLTLYLKEQGLKCQLCKKVHLKNAKPYKGLLIHHKDKNITNNDFDNLLIVCRGCHNKIHKTIRKKRSAL